MEIILKRILSEIETIYNESLYSPNNDLYRITDLIHSIDDNQIISKTWLVDELHKVYHQIAISREETPHIIVGGGWYGLLAYLLKQSFTESRIVSVDCDAPATDIAALRLFYDQGISFVSDCIFEFGSACDIFVSTSVEHLDRNELVYYIKSKPNYTICALQSNDWEAIDSHTNCSESLEDFISYLPLTQIYYKGVKSFSTHNRFMVIGA